MAEFHTVTVCTITSVILNLNFNIVEVLCWIVGQIWFTDNQTILMSSPNMDPMGSS